MALDHLPPRYWYTEPDSPKATQFVALGQERSTSCVDELAWLATMTGADQEWPFQVTAALVAPLLPPEGSSRATQNDAVGQSNDVIRPWGVLMSRLVHWVPFHVRVSSETLRQKVSDTQDRGPYDWFAVAPLPGAAMGFDHAPFW